MTPLITRGVRRSVVVGGLLAALLFGPLIAVASATRYVFVDKRDGSILVDHTVNDGNDQTRFFYLMGDDGLVPVEPSDNCQTDPECILTDIIPRR